MNHRNRATKKGRRLFKRYGLVAVNIGLVVMVGFLVVQNRSRAEEAVTFHSQESTGEVSGPVDVIAAADIAANVALASQSPVAVNASNRADSVRASTTSAPSDGLSVNKPQIVSTGDGAQSTNDIITYTVQAGDTVSSIAQKFNITTKSIKDSNDLSGDKVGVGRTLRLPPRNRSGVVYRVAVGDTVDSIARAFGASAERIASFNDAEINGLTVGSYIFIPDGNKPEPAYAPAEAISSIAYFNPTYRGNSYAYGYCTWYVASRIAVPSNWGNANTWDNYAAASGWTVSSRPIPGAILQTDAGWAGHVGIVEEVNADGTMIKYSDMNGIAGWGRVGYSDWTSASRYRYIYH